MSRKGNPWDNAACESFMKTLKYEEVHRNEYRDLAEARSESAGFWRWSTTKSVCTPLSATYRRRSSKTSSGRLLERRHETDRAFFQAWRNLPADVFLLQKPGPKYRFPAGVGPGS
jgi:transposase InsO family protein